MPDGWTGRMDRLERTDGTCQLSDRPSPHFLPTVGFHNSPEQKQEQQQCWGRWTGRMDRLISHINISRSMPRRMLGTIFVRRQSDQPYQSEQKARKSDSRFVKSSHQAPYDKAGHQRRNRKVTSGDCIDPVQFAETNGTAT